MRRITVLCVAALFCLDVAAQSPLRVTITPNKPSHLTTPAWPVSVGIPFRQGEYRNAGDLTIVDEAGKPVPCQIVKTGDWEDGSLRWILADFDAQLDRKYFLTTGACAESKDDIEIEQGADGVTIQTGYARYVFPSGAATFDSVQLDLNRDGRFDENETLVAGAAGGFYVVDSQGKRSVLRGGKTTLELAGKRHAVLRTEGDYLDSDGTRKAAGVIYFHFYAGRPWARVSHKLIVTEDTNELWFREIGWGIPLRTEGETIATFNKSHGKPQETLSAKLGPQDSARMGQKEFPHFGSTNSVALVTNNETIAGAVGDWADVSNARWGLATQVPGFAEQFPKAFIASSTNLTIKLWASESGQELDFRTPQIIKNYFGHDWIPEDHAVTKVANTAAGTAKTHEIWLYPHVGPLTAERIAQFGATKEEIYAAVDPAWIARSGVMGTFHPRDTQRFPDAEEVIEDCFDRWVLAGDKVFPRNGYLYWGMYPYSSQPWELKNNRWYPKIHRLARCLEYNLKRGVWVLYARSGDRKYFDYARRYTRFLGNFIVSNCDAPLKPRGWMVQGMFDSPIVWGAFGEKGIRAGKAGRKPAFNGEASFLAFASSEDVIQFAYDWFLTGDFHSRDVARMYIEALGKETGFDPDYAVHAGGSRPEAVLRMIGSAYDLEHDPKLLALGGQVLRRLILPDGESNPEFPAQWGKWGDVFGAYYYYWVSTRDPLARKTLVKLAEFQYRRADLDAFFGRSSPLLQAFVFAYEDTQEPAYLMYLGQALDNFSKGKRIKHLGIDVNALNQLTSTPWGQETMTGQGPAFIGAPVAQAALAAHPSPHPYLPFAIKPHPTSRTYLLLNKETSGEATLCVYVNNWGDRTIKPRLLGLDGKPQPLDLIERSFDRITKPEFRRSETFSKWYLKYEDQIFYKLRLPGAVPPGVYHLDLGDEVAFTLLRSDLAKAAQAAPGGLVLLDREPYYFTVPKGVEAVDFFSMQPVEIADPDGQTVACEDLKNGDYRFPTGGRAGAWRITRNDRIPTFVRMKNIPFLVALGDPKRLFEVDTSRFAPTPKVEAPTEAFAEGRFGQAAYFFNQFVELPLAEGFPRERGTVEFWFRPLWSATEFDAPRATVRLQLFRADPVSLAYNVDVNPGNSGNYNQARFDFAVGEAGTTRAQLYLEAGKWYHFALTWNVDGKASECDMFINGRKKSYFHYSPGMRPDASPEKLPPAAQTLLFGSGHLYGKSRQGEWFDELRVSRTVRYREDFVPPEAPFEADADTVLLMRFDGNLEAMVAGAAREAERKKGSKLW